MPLIRKVWKVGNCKVVALPREWYEYFERIEKKEVKEVAIEVDRKLTLSPILEPIPEKIEVKAKR